MTSTLMMMLIVGLIVSFSVLGVFIWGARQGQFDDSEKMMSGLLFDSEDDLNNAIDKEKKVKEAKEAKASQNKENKKANH